MHALVISSLFMSLSLIACTQEKKSDFSSISSTRKSINSVPFLTKNDDFVFVDKSTLKPITNQKFKWASVFTPTGFAIVANEKNESAIIDQSGKIVLDYSPESIEVDVVNGLTFYKKEIEYQKKMPIWNWDWNILGGGIKKEQTNHKIEIGVLETKQIILNDDVPYLEDYYYLNIQSVDEEHVFWNQWLYKIKNQRLHKVENNIVELLEKNRYIKSSNESFSIYKLNQKKALHSGLKGTESVFLKFGNESIVLNSINKDRFHPTVPKLLLDILTNDIYSYPQFEKVFPKEIINATASQIDFIKKTTLVYSISNSPYFLLGVFNYDEKIWAYDWLYIDTLGNVLDAIDSYSFKVLDRIGSVVWPDRKMILPDQFNDKKWKFGKINYYGGMNDLYLIPTENDQELRTKGLWNSQQKKWEINPEYHDIAVLDIEKQIYALQKEKDGTYMLYNNEQNQQIGSKVYSSINSDGLVHIKQDSIKNIYYYIDIYSGKEYRE